MDDVESKGAVIGTFEVSTMNEMLARTTPRTRPLFGDLWMEGELSVMFAEAGCGKSLLAVQIADSIARGVRLKPHYQAPTRQKVVFIDLESLPEQFRRRYSHDDEDREFRPYKFSTNLIRACTIGGAEGDVAAIGELVKTTGARALIIDNIAHLMKNRSSGEAARVMRELRRLTRAEGISILLLAHSAPASLRRGIEACDIPFAAVMTGMADNVFAIGRVGSDSSGRYIKHIKPGSAALTFGAAHVPWFRIRKRANLTYFDFEGFGREGVLRTSDNDRREWQIIDRIRELKELGMSVRQIGRTIEMSKSSVQRFVAMIEDDEEFGRPVACSRPPSKHVYQDDLQRAFAENYPDDGEVTGLWLPELDDVESDDQSDEPREPTPAFMVPDPPPPSPQPEPEPEPPQHPLLERDIDGNGREIFVERRDYHGKRLIWYLAETHNRIPTGKYTRYVNHGGWIGGDTVDCLPGSERGP